MVCVTVGRREATVADRDTIGTPWRDDELDAIVADYFAMLEEELAGHRYVKSHHSAALMKQIGRTHRSVEFKHQNISAVLEELGLPTIAGYKPKAHYQGAIIDAVERYLSRNVHRVDGLAEPTRRWFDGTVMFVDPPPLGDRLERLPALDRLIRKFDPADRDFRNRSLGQAGEEFVCRLKSSACQPPTAWTLRPGSAGFPRRKATGPDSTSCLSIATGTSG
jgi:hypothetical protein